MSENSTHDDYDDLQSWSQCSRDQMLMISSEHLLRSQNLPFDIDVWYRPLKQFTFPSIFIPLNRQEAIALVRFYQSKYKIRKNALQSIDIDVIERLESKISLVLKKNKKIFKHGAFIRLCGRSPKDGDPINRSKVWQDYQSNLQALAANGEDVTDGNTQLRAVAQTSWLRVRTAADAMSLLLSSERVFTDLQDFIRWGEPEQLCLRSWHPQMRYDMEFRVFVCNNVITGISQYDHYCFYPHLQSSTLQRKIQQQICSEWKRLHKHVGMSNYCADFLYCVQDESAVLIELSPFRTCTGAACFSWRDDADTLRSPPIEFRVVTKPRPYTAELVEANWEFRWKSKEKSYLDVLKEHKLRLQSLNAEKNDFPIGFDPLIGAVSLGLFVANIYYAINIPKKTIIITTLLLLLFYYYFRNDFDFKKFKTKKENKLLFVYGTLKRGFHWHDKFMFESKFISNAKTIDLFALVMGDSGVPYLLLETPSAKQQPQHIVGELFAVNAATLKSLDDYEGIVKGYYVRKEIDVVLDNGQVMRADCYLKKEASSDLVLRPFLKEYSLQTHNEHYQPIRHIEAKQQLYMQENQLH